MGGQWKVEDRKVGGNRRKEVGCNRSWAWAMEQPGQRGKDWRGPRSQGPGSASYLPGLLALAEGDG